MLLHAPLFGAIALSACSTDSTSGGDHGIPDLDGLANFIVDSARLASSWTLGSDYVEAGSCTSIEYGISPGTHRVLRFTVSTPNIGDADAVVGDPLAHVDPNHDGDFSDSDGLFEYAPCHNHFHYKHYASALGAPIFCTETWLLHGCQRAIPPRRRYEQLGVACVHDEHHASLMRPR